jgi:hypothetical protein
VLEVGAAEEAVDPDAVEDHEHRPTRAVLSEAGADGPYTERQRSQVVGAKLR